MLAVARSASDRERRMERSRRSRVANRLWSPVELVVSVRRETVWPCKSRGFLAAEFGEDDQPSTEIRRNRQKQQAIFVGTKGSETAFPGGVQRAELFWMLKGSGLAAE